MACTLALARFHAPSSESHIAESWHGKTTSEDVGGVAPEKVNGDGRPDCVQACIALAVTQQGLPLACEVFDGNRTDITTAE